MDVSGAAKKVAQFEQRLRALVSCDAADQLKHFQVTNDSNNFPMLTYI